MRKLSPFAFPNLWFGCHFWAQLWESGNALGASTVSPVAHGCDTRPTSASTLAPSPTLYLYVGAGFGGPGSLSAWTVNSIAMPCSNLGSCWIPGLALFSYMRCNLRL